MAKVGVEIQVTMHIGLPENNEYIHIKASIDEIDAEEDTMPQLERARKAVTDTLLVVEEQLEEKVEQELRKKLR